jgi:hypothetical protein
LTTFRRTVSSAVATDHLRVPELDLDRVPVVHDPLDQEPSYLGLLAVGRCPEVCGMILT